MPARQQMGGPSRSTGSPPALPEGHELRQLILECSKRAGVGHIASALSIADIVDVLVGRVVRGIATEDPHRDLLVLSKGHAALAYYCALRMAGILDDQDLRTYCRDGSQLGVHPEHALAGVEFSTGSLGQGLSLAAGAAKGATIAGRRGHIYVVMSDAELNEGSTWEAVMFAGHHRLANLTVVLDDNGQQALGRTAEVLDIQPVAPKVAMFGWDVVEVDGHDQAALHAALTAPRSGRPTFIQARTVAGYGVDYMEGQVAWHYLPMDGDQFDAALESIAVARPRRVVGR